MIKSLLHLSKKVTFALLLVCAATTVHSQCVQSFYDDLETGAYSPLWLTGTGHTITTTNVSPAEGIYSLDITGLSSFYTGPNVQFTSAQPTSIEWWAKTNNTTVANGYFVVGDANIATNNGIVFCYFNSTSSLRFFNTAGYNYSVTANTWYHIELKNINWTAKTFDIYINSVLWQSNFAFRSPASTDMTQLHTFNLASATASYDKIVIGDMPPTVTVSTSASTVCAGSSVTLTAAGNATAYAWSNSVPNATGFTPTATAIYTVVATGSNSCQNSATTTINISQNPTVTATSNASIICIGQTASLTANGAATYSWNTSSTNTSIAVSPTTTTSYTVTGTTNGCSNAFVITQSVSNCTGLYEKEKTASPFLVYPNPSNGNFIIKTESNTDLTITDALGRTVRSASLNTNEQLEVTGLANGLYFITGKSNNAYHKVKVVITN
jgi:hypothetical protein